MSSVSNLQVNSSGVTSDGLLGPEQKPHQLQSARYAPASLDEYAGQRICLGLPARCGVGAGARCAALDDAFWGPPRRGYTHSWLGLIAPLRGAFVDPVRLALAGVKNSRTRRCYGQNLADRPPRTILGSLALDEGAIALQQAQQKPFLPMLKTVRCCLLRHTEKSSFELKHALLIASGASYVLKSLKPMHLAVSCWIAPWTDVDRGLGRHNLSIRKTRPSAFGWSGGG